jgi:tryptophan synthase alpha chain
MNRLARAFQRAKERGTPALVPFITAGDPDLARTEAIIHVLTGAGADVIELGIPFSDPMADGPVIQAASERALLAGTTLSRVLVIVRKVRETNDTPIVLMGYYNPILAYGTERFAADAVAAGVDGLLLVDLPPEEAQELRCCTDPLDLPLITLIAPTTPRERRNQLAATAQGYLYYVSMTGVTGTARIDTTAIRAEVENLQTLSPVPVAVGFGISTAEDAAAVGTFADAVVVGSALVKIINQHRQSPTLLAEVKDFITEIRAGLDSSRKSL